MTIAYADLTTAFPEFADTTTYPIATVNFWIAQAYRQLSSRRFGTSLDLAVMLFVAHNIVLSYRAAAAGGPGGIGSATGPMASKSVGPASVSYDTGLTAYSGAGFWNATSYGQRYYQMLLAFGTGPMYVPNPRARRAMPGDIGFPFRNGRSDGF